MLLKTLVTVCALMCCLLTNLRLRAADTLMLGSEENTYLYGKHIEILEDLENIHGLEEARMASGWRSLKNVEPLNLPKANTWYWLRFAIQNQNATGLQWTLEFPDGHNSSLQLFQLGPGNVLKTFKPAGLDYPISHRPYDYKNLLFEASIPKGATYVYYVHIRSKYTSSFWASVRSSAFNYSYISREYYFLGFYYGILCIMAIYHFLLFAFTKEKVYVYYVFYVLSCGIYTLSEDLTGFQLFWPNITFFNHWHFENAPGILVLAFTFYSIEFLELKKQYQKLVPLLYGLSALHLIITLFMSDIIPSTIKMVSFVTPFALIYYLAFRLYFTKKYTSARFFLIGFSIILCSFLVYVLRMCDLLPSTLYTIYIFNFGFVVEVVMFSYGLGDKIRLIKEEKEKNQQKIIEVLEEKEILKDKINQELELKVKERTLALQEKTEALKTSNEKLTYLTEELNKMNSQLDLDNWNLQNKVKNETRSRILTEKAGYETFRTIFPNDAYCMQYLETLKWEKGFQCKKCGHTHYGKSEKTFSRKCTKCKYTESVMAATLFHGIKFPLNKAFYITYSSFEEHGVTLEALSEEIELRKATVWSFRKKVLEAKASAQKHKRGLESWNDLILEI